MSFAIAARSGSDAMILRSLRGTPLRRNSLLLTITSPRAKLPNSGRKRPSRRTSRVQKRFLTAIFFYRSRRAAFERKDTRSAEGFGRNEPDWPFATLASCQYALTLYIVKECLLLWSADVPEAEIIFVNQHLSALLSDRLFAADGEATNLYASGIHIVSSRLARTHSNKPMRGYIADTFRTSSMGNFTHL